MQISILKNKTLTSICQNMYNHNNNIIISMSLRTSADGFSWAFDHLEIPRGNIVRKIDSVYIILYQDNFSQIPLYMFISSNSFNFPSQANMLGECLVCYLAQRMERDIYQTRADISVQNMFSKMT